jgi:hypothetical protein
MADVYLAGSIVDVRGQPILVSANVEDRELANRIRVWIRFAHIHETGPPQSLGSPIPVVKRRLRVLVSVRELPKGLAADDAYANILSK